MVQSVCPNNNTLPLTLQGAESSWIHTAADADISMYHRPFALSSHWRAKYNYLEVECSILWFLKHTPSSLILWKSLLPSRLPFLVGIHLIKGSWQLHKSSLTTRIWQHHSLEFSTVYAQAIAMLHLPFKANISLH